jgi:hypothetical protein
MERVCVDTHLLTNTQSGFDAIATGGPLGRTRQLAHRLPWRRHMSHKTVQFVIGWLLTDDDLRRRFVERPRETLAELCERGYELTPDEFEALLLCDPTMWTSTAQKLHPHLRRASLRWH